MVGAAIRQSARVIPTKDSHKISPDNKETSSGEKPI
jgi:hypothetical protein